MKIVVRKIPIRLILLLPTFILRGNAKILFMVGGEKVKLFFYPSSQISRILAVESLDIHGAQIKESCQRVSEERQWLPCQLWGQAAGWQRDKCVVSLSRTVYRNHEVWQLPLPLGPESAAPGWGCCCHSWFGFLAYHTSLPAT